MKGRTVANLHPLRPEQRVISPDFGAPKARVARRHWWLFASFLLAVILPVLATATYLFAFAQPRFVSESGFSIRVEDVLAQPDLLSGFTGLGSATQTDAALVRQFLESPALVSDLRDSLALDEALAPTNHDPLFTSPLVTIQALTRRWNRIVEVSLDSRTDLITVKVSAFSPETSLQLNQAMLDAASAMIAGLSDQARADATAHARQELASAEARLTVAQQKLTEARADNRVVDPASDLESRLGVLTALQTQMSEAQIALGLLLETSNKSDPRVSLARNRVGVIANLIEAERAKFGSAANGYAHLTSEFETLLLQVECARESYLSARATLDSAIIAAQRESRFLAVHIPPSRPDNAEKPEKAVTLLVVVAGSLLFWFFAVFGLYGYRGRA